MLLPCCERHGNQFYAGVGRFAPEPPKNTQNLIFYRREIQTALPFALCVSTSPCRCHFERSAQHRVEILRKQNREAKSRQGFAQDDRGGDSRKDF